MISRKGQGNWLVSTPYLRDKRDMEHSMNMFLIIVGFTIIALASRQVGQYFARAKLPLISGFLFTG